MLRSVDIFLAPMNICLQHNPTSVCLLPRSPWEESDGTALCTIGGPDQALCEFSEEEEAPLLHFICV